MVRTFSTDPSADVRKRFEALRVGLFLASRPADPWSRRAGASLGNDEACARIVALDLLIGNEDRHRDNILLATTKVGGARVVAIDHEQAWAGFEGALTTDRMPDLDKYPEDFAEHAGVLDHLPRVAAEIAATEAVVWRRVAGLAGSCVAGTDISSMRLGLGHRAGRLSGLADGFIRGHKVRA